MGSAAPSRPVTRSAIIWGTTPLTSELRRKLTIGAEEIPMGIYVGLAPSTGYSAESSRPTREALVDAHCLREARREVECWLLGTVYHWQPYDDRLHGLLPPIRSGVPPLLT